jgi:universal stress protein A
VFELKQVACAIDLSEPSRITMEYAADLAKLLRAELTLLHAHEPSGRAPSVPDKMLEQWRVEAEARVGSPVRSRLLAGDPSTAILRHAVDYSCDLLVVGMRSRTGVSRLTLGSVAEGVIRSSPCPVLVARNHHFAEKAADAEEIAQYR